MYHTRVLDRNYILCMNDYDNIPIYLHKQSSVSRVSRSIFRPEGVCKFQTAKHLITYFDLALVRVQSTI